MRGPAGGRTIGCAQRILQASVFEVNQSFERVRIWTEDPLGQLAGLGRNAARVASQAISSPESRARTGLAYPIYWRVVRSRPIERHVEDYSETNVLILELPGAAGESPNRHAGPQLEARDVK